SRGDLWGSALEDFRAQKCGEALNKFKLVVKQRPEFGTAWAMMGICEIQVGEYENARLHLQKGNDLGFGGSSESVRGARYALASLLIRNGEFDRATNLLVNEAEGATLAPEIQFALGMALLRMPMMANEVPDISRELVSRAGEIAILLYN